MLAVDNEGPVEGLVVEMEGPVEGLVAELVEGLVVEMEGLRGRWRDWWRRGGGLVMEIEGLGRRGREGSMEGLRGRGMGGEKERGGGPMVGRVWRGRGEGRRGCRWWEALQLVGVVCLLVGVVCLLWPYHSR